MALENKEAAAKQEEKKGRKPRPIPKSVESHFSEEEKKLYAKDVKELKCDEVKRLIEIRVKIVRLQGRMIAKKIEDRSKVNPKLLSYAKCIFAEEILAKKPELLKEIQGKEYTPNGAKGLEALAKLHNLDLRFKAKPKTEKKEA
jgi:hypothetical protein